jgi:predicted dehydrogenase
MPMNRRTFMASAAAAVAGTALAQPPGGGRLRACVIGDSKQGGYGHHLHLLWSLRDDVEVVGLADPDEAGRAQHGEEAKAAKLYADYREMLRTEKPDLVAIGPRSTINHREYLLACAEVGAHGIIEKPLAPDLQEADEVLAALDAKGLKWAIAFNFRSSPVVHAVKKAAFEDGIIGQILEMRGRGKEDPRAGGEDLIVLGTHLFDMMRFFAGAPRWCMSYIGVDDRPASKADVREATEPIGPVVGNQLNATFGFDRGVTGHFASVKNPGGNAGRWGIDLYGTKGIINVRQAPIPLVSVLQDPVWAPGLTKKTWGPLPGLPDVQATENTVWHYQPIIDDLMAAIAEDRRPAYSVHDGRAALEMCMAVFEAPIHGGLVQFPLEERSHPLTRWTS